MQSAEPPVLAERSMPPGTSPHALRGLLLASQLAVFILLLTWIFGYLGGVSLHATKAGFAAGSNDTGR